MKQIRFRDRSREWGRGKKKPHTPYPCKAFWPQISWWNNIHWPSFWWPSLLTEGQEESSKLPFSRYRRATMLGNMARPCRSSAWGCPKSSRECCLFTAPSSEERKYPWLTFPTTIAKGHTHSYQLCPQNPHAFAFSTWGSNQVTIFICLRMSYVSIEGMSGLWGGSNPFQWYSKPTF